MAKSKSDKKDKHLRKKSTTSSAASVLSSMSSAPPEPTESLITRAKDLFEIQSLPQEALDVIQTALKQSPTSLPALNLAGHINIDLGDIAAARTYLEKAVEHDPTGQLDGPEKFMSLAQICEEGGDVAVAWYQRGVEILRRWIAEGSTDPERGLEGKLCSALCGMAEIYMTDLCFAPDAESRCETYITEALLINPDSPEALQTLASIRISQERMTDARAALARSYALWRRPVVDEDSDDDEDEETEIVVDAENPDIPSYPARLAFAKLLIECDMLEEGMEVLERLQMEDDQVVDLWYIGGWCLYLIGKKGREAATGMESVAATTNGNGKSKQAAEDEDKDEEDEPWEETWQSSRIWLRNAETLYKATEHDDEQLAESMVELLQELDGVLGEPADEEMDEGGEEDVEWEDEDEDEEDVKMADS